MSRIKNMDGVCPVCSDTLVRFVLDEEDRPTVMLVCGVCGEEVSFLIERFVDQIGLKTRDVPTEKFTHTCPSQKM